MGRVITVSIETEELGELRVSATLPDGVSMRDAYGVFDAAWYAAVAKVEGSCCEASDASPST